MKLFVGHINAAGPLLLGSQRQLVKLSTHLPNLSILFVNQDLYED